MAETLKGFLFLFLQFAKIHAVETNKPKPITEIFLFFILIQFFKVLFVININ